MAKLHIEAMRLDEVPHAAEVPSLERGVEIVDVAEIGINLPGRQGYSSYRGRSRMV